MVLANIRERLHQYAVDIDLVRKNPLRSVRELMGRLMFEPQNLVIATRANWVGHSNNPASEIVIEHRGLPSSSAKLVPGDAKPILEEAADLASSSSQRLFPSVTRPEVLSASSGPEFGQILQSLSAQILKLEAQVEVLTRRMQEQDLLLHKLESKIDRLRGSKQRTAPNSTLSP